jgi:RES domain-containing protein
MRQEPRLYASSTVDGMWGELFRHVEPEISPFEVRRRQSELRVTNLPVLDLTDPDVRALFNVTRSNLVGNRYADCRAIADIVRLAPVRFGGILAPSAVGVNAKTLVVFREWVSPAVTVVHERIRTPPMRLFGLWERLIETLPPRSQDAARATLRRLRREWAKRRRTR